MAKAIDNQILMLRPYANIGRVFSKKGDYPKALNNFYKGLKIAKKLKLQKEHAGSLNSIGLVFSKFKMHEESISCYEKSMTIYESMNSKKGMGMINNNLALRYLAQDSILKAEYHIEKALSLYNEIGIKSKGNLLLNFAEIQIKKKQYGIAEKTIHESIEVAQNGNQEDLLAGCYSALGRLYLQTQNNFDDVGVRTSSALK